MSASLVGSEMCIRDSPGEGRPAVGNRPTRRRAKRNDNQAGANRTQTCLLYTSDAADDMQV
eukprot:5993777-Alexandrium_andersonii.AAC.1